jgi:hypothetical protein
MRLLGYCNHLIDGYANFEEAVHGWTSPGHIVTHLLMLSILEYYQVVSICLQENGRGENVWGYVLSHDMTSCRDGNRNRSSDRTAGGGVELVMACIGDLVLQSQLEAIGVGALVKDQ